MARSRSLGTGAGKQEVYCTFACAESECDVIQTAKERIGVSNLSKDASGAKGQSTSPSQQWNGRGSSIAGLDLKSRLETAVRPIADDAITRFA